jgi:hypothetical protein
MERVLNGQTSARQAGRRIITTSGGESHNVERNVPEGETRENEDEAGYPLQDDRGAMEHYLNQSIVSVVKELLSWKARYLSRTNAVCQSVRLTTHTGHTRTDVNNWRWR